MYVTVSAVQALASFAEIDPWVRAQNDRDAEVAVFLRSSARESFLVLYAVFVRQFGMPDYPDGDVGRILRDSLRFAADTMLVIWDFDDYQLSLRLEEVDGETTAILARHDNVARSDRNRRARRTAYEEGRDALIASFGDDATPTADEANELDAAWNTTKR